MNRLTPLVITFALTACPVSDRVVTVGDASVLVVDAADARTEADASTTDGDDDACANPGCECADTASDPKNCGVCGHDCSAVPHLGSTADVKCSAGKCVIPASACAAGFADCNGNPDDGCEADLGTPERCGACSTKCSPDAPLCTPSGCKATCPAAAPTQCGSSCADIAADPKHCGDCSTECPQPTSGGNATCKNKICGIACNQGYHACGNNCFIDTDPSHCGDPACAVCPGPNAQCVSGSCIAPNPILSLPGLKFYVDRLVASPTLSGSNVTAWPDESGQGNDLNRVSSTNPQWVDGVGVQFTASKGTFLRRLGTNLVGTGSGVAADAYTLGIVMRFDGTNGLDQSFFSNTDTSIGGVSFSYSDAGLSWQIQHVNAANQQDGSLATGTFYVLTIRRPTGGADVFRVNDVVRTLNPADTGPLNPGAAAVLIMGARSNGSGATDQHGNCTIAAAFVCHADVGEGSISNVVAYWRSKYGI